MTKGTISQKKWIDIFDGKKIENLIGERIIMEQEPRITKKKYKTIDRDLVFRLACIQCSDVEIAEAVNISVEVLKKRFSKIIEQGRQEGKQ